MYIKMKDLGRAKKIIVIVKCEERDISRYKTTNATGKVLHDGYLKKKKKRKEKEIWVLR